MVAIPGYEVQELLSWGSQGDVFRGRNRAGELVAIKLVTADRTDGDPQAMERLRREARLLAALDSPHVVKVRDYLQGEGWCCLVLEFLAGERLDKGLQRQAGIVAAAGSTPSQATVVLPVPQQRSGSSTGQVAARAVPAALCTPAHVAWVLDVASQLAAGLAEMHHVRLIHRDIKPQNVMLVDGRVVLIDFGFARRDGVTTMTQAGTAIGTLAYMAPELLAGREANESSDVYAFGASLYQCLTGAPPFGSDATTIRAMATRGRPRDVRRRNRAVDAALAAVVGRCLEPDARDRYADARAVAADLQRVARGEPVRAPFSLGRAWRHHGRVLLTVAAMLTLLLTVLYWATSNPLGRLAAQIRAEVADGREAAAVDGWMERTPTEQDAAVQHLNRMVATHEAEARKLAAALGLAFVRLTARAHHRVALVPCRDPARAPALDEAMFVPADTATCLLVRPGRCWCFVQSGERSHWWGPDDPRCLQLLLDVGLGEDAPPRRLELLPTEPAHPHRVDVRSFAAGVYAVPVDAKAIHETDIAVSFAVGVHEVSQNELWSFRRTMADRFGDRDELDRWLRHPDEPPTLAAAIWQRWREVGAHDDSKKPAKMAFWEAHRFAAWYGFRLPVLAEWRVAACLQKQEESTDDRLLVPDEPLAVQDASTWDVTSRGLIHPNSNVREWTADRRDLVLPAKAGERPVSPMAMFAAPATARWNPKGGVGKVRFSKSIVGGGDLPEREHGLRLYRTLLGEVAR